MAVTVRFLSVILFIVVLLSGCVNQIQPSTTTTINKITVTTQSTIPGPTIPPKQINDMKIAIATGDADSCNKVEDIRLREMCLREIALKNNDPKMCDQLTLIDLREPCYQKVSKATGNKEICNKITLEVIKKKCLA